MLTHVIHNASVIKRLSEMKDMSTMLTRRRGLGKEDDNATSCMDFIAERTRP